MVRVMCTCEYMLHVRIHDKRMTVSEKHDGDVSQTDIYVNMNVTMRVYTCDYECAWCK